MKPHERIDNLQGLGDKSRMVTLFPVAMRTVLSMMHFADNVVMDGLSLDKRELAIR